MYQLARHGLWIARLLTGPIRLLPDFIIIGAQRCGTSSLYEYLVKHPRVVPAFHKEVHFFDLQFSKGTAWYRAHFPSVPSRFYARQIRNQDFITGEASPYYIFYPHAPGRILQTVPTARLIALLRNPVDRAYSHYHHEVRMRLETLSFEDAIEGEDSRLRGETERMLQDEGYFSSDHLHYSYLSRGIYVDQLQVSMNSFPEDQMLILRSEDFYDDPGRTLRMVLEFLNLPSWQPGEYRRYNYGRYPEMSASTRRRLTEYFEPHNERLYDRLGVDLGWGRSGTLLS